MRFRTVRRLLALAALLGLAACGSTDKVTNPVDDNPFLAAKVGTDSTLEVVTWNIENFPKKGATTVDYVIDAIAAMDADIVALQEIKGGVEFLQVDSALQGYSGFRANSSYADLNLAFLYRNDGTLTDVAVTEILTWEHDLPRSPLVLQATFKGTPITVIDNHFLCCGDGTLDLDDGGDEETRRFWGCQALAGFIRENYAGRRVFMVGDMNDELDDVPVNNVFNVFLDAPTEFRFADLPIALDPQGTVSYPSWGSHLDHIMVTAPLFEALDAAGAEVRVLRLDDSLSGGMSTFDTYITDHRPVMIKLVP